MPWLSMPTASMQASGPMPPVISASASRTFTSSKSRTSAPSVARQREAARVMVDGDHAMRA